MALRLRKLPCLNGKLIPFQTHTVTILRDGGKEDIEDDIKVLLLDLAASADTHSWLTGRDGGLGVNVIWCRCNFSKVPLFQELMQAIKDQKDPKKGKAKWPKAVVEVTVRGKIMMVKNDYRSVKLAFEACGDDNEDLSDDNMKLLDWFLQDLHKDIQAMIAAEPLPLVDGEAPKRQGRSEQPAAKKLKTSTGYPKLDAQLEQSLMDLTSHANCVMAVWMSSRRCFKLKKKNEKVYKELYPKALAKYLKKAGQEKADEGVNAGLDLASASIKDAFCDAEAYLEVLDVGGLGKDDDEEEEEDDTESEND